jgi:hypothetical protein
LQDALVAQDGEMLRDIALRGADGFDDVLHAGFLVADHAEDFQAQRMRDRLQRRAAVSMCSCLPIRSSIAVACLGPVMSVWSGGKTEYYRILRYAQHLRLPIMYKIVLLRHGESTWNQENRFTGWTDVGLTEKGIRRGRSGPASC